MTAVHRTYIGSQVQNRSKQAGRQGNENLLGMCTSLTKKPMKPINRNPTMEAKNNLLNSTRDWMKGETQTGKRNTKEHK